MSVRLFGAGIFTSDDIAHVTLPPAWRKATRNMVLATMSMERAFAQIPQISKVDRSRVALVMGSSSGELETSAEFLATWSKTKLARPLLFQNSLHNATAGFASIHFQIRGATFSLSGGSDNPEECVELASGLLNERACAVCIVTLVEAHQNMAQWFGDGRTREGACTLVLATDHSAAHWDFGSGRPFVARPKDLNFRSAPASQEPLVSIEDSGFYDLALRESSAR